jgi:hypothetical protein
MSGRAGTRVSGRVVVDITSPVDFSSFTPIDVPAGSAAQQGRREPSRLNRMLPLRPIR